MRRIGRRVGDTSTIGGTSCHESCHESPASVQLCYSRVHDNQSSGGGEGGVSSMNDIHCKIGHLNQAPLERQPRHDLAHLATVTHKNSQPEPSPKQVRVAPDSVTRCMHAVCLRVTEECAKQNGRP